MKRTKTLLLFTLICLVSSTMAQKKDFDYKFYGFVRGDFSYNTRASVAPYNGAFYLYPYDVVLDADGNDINSTPSSGFYAFVTRLGVDVAGPRIGTATTQAKVEMDFAGFSPSNTMLRIRHAYVKLGWEKQSLLIGQTWHPLFGSIMPDISSLCTGAPYQPFNRSPQVRYEFNHNRIKLTAAALWQLQYLSYGPNGPSAEYSRNSTIPELYAGIDYSTESFQIGGGVDMISLKPRTVSTVGTEIYKVDERMTALSTEIHLKYLVGGFRFAMKSILASALDHTAMLSGYGVTGVDSRTGEQQYTPFRHSTTWVNITYGKRWKPTLFVGYTKNLGTSESLVSGDKLYGMGLNIDQLVGVNLGLTYNLPYWIVGLEYAPSTAWYGSNDLETGRVVDASSVTNHRIVAIVTYSF